MIYKKKLKWMGDTKRSHQELVKLDSIIVECKQKLGKSVRLTFIPLHLLYVQAMNYSQTSYAIPMISNDTKYDRSLSYLFRK